MAGALVLINVEMSSEVDVLKAIRKIEGVVEAFAVYGAYDIAARVQADTIEKLDEIITGKIRKIENVKSTLTMMIIDERSLGLEWMRT